MSLTGFNRARRLTAFRADPSAERVETASGEQGVTEDLRDAVQAGGVSAMTPAETSVEPEAEPEPVSPLSAAPRPSYDRDALEEFSRAEIRDLAEDLFGMPIPMTAKPDMIDRFLEEQSRAGEQEG